MSWRGVHRWLAIFLVALLVVWSVTGVLFHIKPGWGRAYDMLEIDRPGGADLHAWDFAGLPGFQRVELVDTILGPLARLTTRTGTALYDRKGIKRSPLAPEDAVTLAVDAVSRSPFRAGYGGPVDTRTTETDVWITFSEGPIVRVSRADAQLTQRGLDTDRIDLLYRIHYLQWTGNPQVDRIIPLAGLGLIWLVMIPGIVLFFRRRR